MRPPSPIPGLLIAAALLAGGCGSSSPTGASGPSLKNPSDTHTGGDFASNATATTPGHAAKGRGAAAAQTGAGGSQSGASPSSAAPFAGGSPGAGGSRGGASSGVAGARGGAPGGSPAAQRAPGVVPTSTPTRQGSVGPAAGRGGGGGGSSPAPVASAPPPSTPAQRDDIAAAKSTVNSFITRINNRDANVCTDLMTQHYVEKVNHLQGPAAIAKCKADISRSTSRTDLHRIEGVQIDGANAFVQFIASSGSSRYRQLLVLLDISGRYWVDDSRPPPSCSSQPC